MHMRNKLWRNTCRIMRRRRWLVLIACACFVLIWWNWTRNGSTLQSVTSCAAIDVVYTWVNGSDPAFIADALRYDVNYDPARFDDKHELRYSLRSLELYAPWVRHVYIVTNGQIPNWLDLSYERVTIVPHLALSKHPELLPTFSSAAIETFLHRIPSLSQRFLYMNDDIFLGAPLFPEDLYTEAEGVRIYQAWMVPDCADDCPWTYIGDGACDRHCNIPACQYDGGDCTPGVQVGESLVEHEVSKKSSNESQPKLAKRNITANFEVRRFPKRKKLLQRKQAARNITSFKALIRQRNQTTLNELRHIVDSYNKRLQWNVHANNPNSTSAAITAVPKAAAKVETYKSSKDIYSHSLINTNMLLNCQYGFKARNVLAHVGFLLEREIIDAMQAKFMNEIIATAANRFRSANDLQFAFAYYTFLMSETRTVSVAEIFDEFDTDGSQTWSDREVRTFLARIYPLPLDWSAMRFFEEVVNNCSRNMASDIESSIYSTLVYERYEDSNLPTITRDLVSKCTLLAEALESNFAVRPKYKYNVNSKRSVHSNFMMLTSNVTEVVHALDMIRRNPRKFNCINDNLELQFKEENELIRHLLEDFYLSFFPRRSRFELQPQYRNRFVNWQDYQRWRRRKRAALVVGYASSVILIVFLFRFLCMHKAKCARRYIQKL